MNIDVVQIVLTGSTGGLPSVGVRIIVELVAAGENIIGSTVCIKAAEGDGGIQRIAGDAVKKSSGADAVRDPIRVATSGSGHHVTFNLEAAGIPVRSGASRDHVGELGCGRDTPLGRR